MNFTSGHNVYIPSSALQKSTGAAPVEEVMVVATVISSTHFKVSSCEGSTFELHETSLVRLVNLLLFSFIFSTLITDVKKKKSW